MLTFDEFKQKLKDLGIELKDNVDKLKEVFTSLTSGKQNRNDDNLAQLKALLEDLKPKPNNDDANASNSNDDKDKTVLALQAEIKALTQLLAEMKKQNDAQAEAQKEKLEKEREKKIADLKKKGIDEGKLTEAKWEEKWKAIAEKDPQQFETILEGLAVDPTFKKSDDKNNSGGDSGSTYKGPLSGASPTILDAMNKMDSV